MLNTEYILECRVQYINDKDPFKSVNSPEPTTPPYFKFNKLTSLCDQLPNVFSLLTPPFQVAYLSFIFVSNHLIKLNLTILARRMRPSALQI